MNRYKVTRLGSGDVQYVIADKFTYNSNYHVEFTTDGVVVALLAITDGVLITKEHSSEQVNKTRATQGV